MRRSCSAKPTSSTQGQRGRRRVKANRVEELVQEEPVDSGGSRHGTSLCEVSRGLASRRKPRSARPRRASTSRR
jgi:hypothetical protein